MEKLLSTVVFPCDKSQGISYYQMSGNPDGVLRITSIFSTETIFSVCQNGGIPPCPINTPLGCFMFGIWESGAGAPRTALGHAESRCRDAVAYILHGNAVVNLGNVLKIIIPSSEFPCVLSSNVCWL